MRLVPVFLARDVIEKYQSQIRRRLEHLAISLTCRSKKVFLHRE